MKVAGYLEPEYRSHCLEKDIVKVALVWSYCRYIIDAAHFNVGKEQLEEIEENHQMI